MYRNEAKWVQDMVKDGETVGTNPSIRVFEKGDTIRHFKGGLYIFICEALHTETNEMMVVYESDATGEVFTRPKEMFYSEVDREKYPDCTQCYRMEKLWKFYDKNNINNN